MDAPREDLIRAVMVSPTAGAYHAPEVGRTFELRADGDGNTLVGYPIVFDTWAEIDSWEGRFLERISPTAVNRTLKQRADQIKVEFNHGMDPMIGHKPLGRPRVMSPDRVGMWSEVPLSATSYNDDVRELIRDGAVTGQSFRFSVTNEGWDDHPEPSEDNPDGIPERTVTEIKLFEFGPVTYPAYEATTVGIRSREGMVLWLGTPRLQRDSLLRHGRLLDSTEATTATLVEAGLRAEDVEDLVERVAAEERDEEQNDSPPEESGNDRSDPAPAGTSDTTTAGPTLRHSALYGEPAYWHLPGPDDN